MAVPHDPHDPYVEHLQTRMSQLPEDFASLRASVDSLRDSVDLLRGTVQQEGKERLHAAAGIEQRVRILENYRYLLMGAVAVAMAFGSFAAELLVRQMYMIH